MPLLAAVTLQLQDRVVHTAECLTPRRTIFIYSQSRKCCSSSGSMCTWREALSTLRYHEPIKPKLYAVWGARVGNLSRLSERGRGVPTNGGHVRHLVVLKVKGEDFLWKVCVLWYHQWSRDKFHWERILCSHAWKQGAEFPVSTRWRIIFRRCSTFALWYLSLTCTVSSLP